MGRAGVGIRSIEFFFQIDDQGRPQMNKDLDNGFYSE